MLAVTERLSRLRLSLLLVTTGWSTVCYWSRAMFRVIILSCLALALAAAEPVLSLQIPSLQRTQERFAGSPYGKAWNVPQAEALHMQLQGLAAMASFQLGINPLVLLAQAHGLELEIYAPTTPDGKPGLRGQLRGAEAAKLVAQALAARGAELPFKHRLLEDRLLLATDPAWLEREMPVGKAGGDIVYTWNREALAKMVLAAVPERERL